MDASMTSVFVCILTECRQARHFSSSLPSFHHVVRFYLPCPIRIFRSGMRVQFAVAFGKQRGSPMLALPFLPFPSYSGTSPFSSHDLLRAPADTGSQGAKEVPTKYRRASFHQYVYLEALYVPDTSFPDRFARVSFLLLVHSQRHAPFSSESQNGPSTTEAPVTTDLPHILDQRCEAADLPICVHIFSRAH